MRTYPIVDAHCDTLLKCYHYHQYLEDRDTSRHIDLPRLEKSGVHVQFFAVFVENEFKPWGVLRRTLQIIDYFYLQLHRYQNRMLLACTFEDILRAQKEGKIAAILSVEGGDALENELGMLRILYRLGVRSLGLTWNNRNFLADGVAESKTGGGLTAHGVEVIKEMNRLKMLIDLAHISEKGFWEALELSSAPLTVSHSNCRAICDHPRNLTDQQIKGLAAKGGVLGITFAPPFLTSGRATLENVLEHIDHVCSLIGTQNIGIGSDFDGIKNMPEGLEDASKWYKLRIALLKRGYTSEEVKNILGRNYLRLLERLWT